MTHRSTLVRKLEPFRAAAAMREASRSTPGPAVPRPSAVIHRLHPVPPDDWDARRDRRAALLLVASAGALAAVLGVVVLSHLFDRSDVVNPAEVALATEGKVVYAVNCATCHGANLQGGAFSTAVAGASRVPPPLNAAGHAWLHSDTALFEIVKYGMTDCDGTNPTTPPLRQLDDAAIWRALAYVKSTWPAPIRRVQSTLDSVRSNIAVATGRPICNSRCRPMLSASTASSEPAASP